MTNTTTVAIINYGMGNIRSVLNAVNSLEVECFIAESPGNLDRATHVILPGVGAFGEAMSALHAAGWVEAIHTLVASGKPLLGICLGLQLFAETSKEHGHFEGLSLISGTVERLESTGNNLRIPHIGWNDVLISPSSILLSGLGPQSCFYFAHSYALKITENNHITGTCDYTQNFIASIEYKNIFATQFHPEKSQKAGLTVLSNFTKFC